MLTKKRHFFHLITLLPILCGMAFFSVPDLLLGAENPPAVRQPSESIDDKESSDHEIKQTPGEHLRTVTLSGHVVDAARRPIEGAVVTVNASPFSEATTGKDGAFVLRDVAENPEVPFEISKEGYFPLFVTVSVPQAQGAPFSFTLAPIPPEVPIAPAEPAKGPAVREQGEKASEGKAEKKDEKKGEKEEGKREKAKVDNAVHIEADTLSYDQNTDTYHAKGNVVVTYADGVLSAVMVDVDRKTNEAFAEGQVVLQSKDGDVVEGEKARMDIDKKTGVIAKGQIFVAKTHLYVSGDRIEKRGEATYFVVNPQLTACDGVQPDWHFAGKTLDVTIDGYGTITNSRFYAKDAPVFYSPYLLFPVKTTRQTGLLFPERMSYSQNKLGWDTSIPFFWAISEDSDATFHQRYMSERGYQQGVEYRYALKKDIYGTIYADFLQDQKKITETVGNISRDWNGDQKRWSVYMNHEARFDKSMYFRADVAKVSDSFYFKDFYAYNYFTANYAGTRPQPFKKISFMADESLNTLESNVRFVKSWNAYNLTTRIRDVQDFTVATNDVTLQKYPEITLAGMRQSLFGTRVQYELSGVYDYFYRGQGQKGHLLDAYPTLSMPFRLGDYANITPFSGVRELIWNRDDSVDDGAGKQGSREVYTFGTTATSEVSRIYNIGGKTLDKIRHAIRPELTYIYSPNARQDNVPDFVTAATQQNTVTTALNKVLSTQTNGGIGATAPVASDQNSATYSFTNTLIARMKDEKGNKKYVEFFRWKVAQTYDLKEANRETILADVNRKPFSDVSMEIDFRPVTYLTFLARDKYSVYNATWSQANYDLILSDKRGDSASVTYRYTQDAIEETNIILKTVLTKSLNLILRLKRDHFNHRDVERMVGFDYRRQCWAVGLDYGERNNDRTYAFRFAIYGL